MPPLPVYFLFVLMSNAEFNQQFANEIAALWRTASPRYNVAEAEFVARLQANAMRYVISGDKAEMVEFLSQLKASDLCLALACEKGSDVAWRDFETTHRSMMIAAARTLTKDQSEAEDLTQTVYGDLFGVRESGEQRASKLSHYSGRGSLGGWLRAVVYQTFIDRKRQTARMEQVEDVSEFERLANQSDIKLTTGIARPDEALEAKDGHRWRQVMEGVMSKAFSSLEVRDRLLLNYYYFDELTLKEIGVVMNVHEATISRWLSKAQQTVRKMTEENLRKMGLQRAQITECLQLAARSEIDVRQIISEAKGAATERAP
ncbi:MAG: sigma-70 family RNA polymerase sigma factor [Blastocatellia bacterium]|nr:sigma-70 family RNA polymerase sigma factor [Blastocatellia bacterium]